MLAFRVVVDGKALGDLGVANFSNTSVVVGFGRASNTDPVYHHLRIGGLTQPDDDGVCRHYRWASPDLREGSRVEIEIVNSKNCVAPTRLYRSDHEVQEPAFTDDEMREMRYEDYLELKKEFEP